MELGQIGPLTTLLENLATSIGAGMLLGGFAAGAAGVVARWRRPVLDAYVLFSSYAGGAGSVVVVLTDVTLRYL